MAITIVNDLYEYNPVRNQVRFRVQASAFNPGAQVRPLLSIGFNPADLPSDGDTITLTSEVLGGDVEFTFLSAYDDEEPLELPAYNSGGASAYVSQLATALQAKYPIAANYLVVPFDFGAGVYGIVILALNLSSDPDVDLYTPAYDLQWSKTGFTEATETTTNANSFELPANAAIIFQLFMDVDNPNGDVRLIIEDEYPPDHEGKAHIDVEDALRTHLRPTFPAVANTAVVSAFGSWASFYLRACERYGDPVESRTTKSSAIAYAYLAGRSEEQRAAYPNYEDQVIRIGTNIRFLTTWPNTVEHLAKSVTPDQVEYLAWIFPSDRGNEWVLRADLYWETGSPTIGHQLAAINNKNRHLLLCPVGMEQCNLASVDPLRRLRAYRVYLTNTGSTVRSEYRYYTVDHRYHHYRTQLVYWTPSGGLDTIMLLGAASHNADVDIQRSARHVLPPTTSTGANDAVGYLQRTGSIIEQGTGWLREAELPALLDLIGSEEVRIIANDAWVPVELLDKGDIDLTVQGAGLQSRTIKYRIAHTGRANL